MLAARSRSHPRFRPAVLLDARLGWALSVVGTVVTAAAAVTPPVRQAGIAETIPVHAAVALLVGVVSVMTGAAILTARRLTED